MGQIVVNVGSFDLTSHNGNTAYSSVRYFDIPANAGITACVATFATHVNTGSFQGKSFSLNGTQAHPNTPWPTSGISLNTALLSAGQNTFRAAVKSQAGLSARWSIGDIYLTITYNDIGGGDPPPPPNIGTITLNKSSMLAGETVNVSLSPCDNGIYRSIRVKWQGTLITSLVIGGDVPSGATYTYTFPLADCSRMPNDTSGSLTFEMETSVDITVTRTMIIQVPDSVVPTIGAFTALLDKNGVDGTITNYVQNYSKCYLEVLSQEGALGSTIAAVEITGGGFSAATKTTTFGPFSQTGNITFTAKVTDTRGRTATRTVTINVLSYGPPAFSNPEAWRSSDTGVKNQKGTYARLKSGVVYSSLDGQNAFTLKGRVYPKGGTVPAYTSMTPDTPWITGGGLLLVTKTYIAQMEVADLIGSRVIEFTIPTKKTGISIMAGMQGIAFGKSVEIPGITESAWPIVAPGLAPNPNLLHNWDFRNPVNQRGVSGAVSGNDYFYDRWFRYSIPSTSPITLNSGYINLPASVLLGQNIEGLWLGGKTVTLSIMLSDGSIHTHTNVFPSSGSPSGTTNNGSDSLAYYKFRRDPTSMHVQIVPASTALNIVCVKLELGSISTLHLDPPMDWAVEVPKCQRFFRIRSTNNVPTVDLSPSMRITPTVTGSGPYYYSADL